MIYADMDTKVSFFYGKKCIVNKIRNGGIYLIDLKGNVNPEFGMKYYCVLVNTIDKDLFLAFPTTISIK